MTDTTKREAETAELLPCPFCGSEAEKCSLFGNPRGRIQVRCKNSDCGVDAHSVETWQQRSASLATPAVPSPDAPKRYWMIEQPDLDDDDDYKRIHTTDLDVYPDAIILGEYVLKTPDMADGWHDINSAPKDKVVDLYFDHSIISRREVNCRWGTIVGTNSNGWLNSRGYECKMPTHWMICAAPKQDESVE